MSALAFEDGACLRRPWVSTWILAPFQATIPNPLRRFTRHAC